jgi:hypothetical protein
MLARMWFNEPQWNITYRLYLVVQRAASATIWVEAKRKPDDGDFASFLTRPARLNEESPGDGESAPGETPKSSSF